MVWQFRVVGCGLRACLGLRSTKAQHGFLNILGPYGPPEINGKTKGL